MNVLDDEVWPLIGRAKEHAATLSEAIKTWRDKNPNPMRIEGDDEGRVYTLHWMFDPPHAQRDWGCVLGDFVHNLRAALDHLIWQLVLHDHGNPGTSNEFPIFDDAVNYGRSSPRKLRGITNPAVLALVERYQPYNPLPPTVATANLIPHPLWVVHELDRLHKHQAIQFPMHLPADTAGTITVNSSTPVESTVELYLNVPSEHDAVFARIAVDGPSDGVDVNFQGTNQVAVQAVPGTLIEIGQVIRTSGVSVSRIIFDFERQFFS